MIVVVIVNCDAAICLLYSPDIFLKGTALIMQDSLYILAHGWNLRP